MPIEIDLNSLKRFWYLPGGHLQFMLKADLGPHEPELDDLLEITAGIRSRLATSANNPADAEGWVRTKSGWGGVLTGAFTLDHGLEWLELFAATWQPLDGKILGGPRSPGPRVMRGDPVVTAFVAYTTGDLTTVPSDDRGPLWFVDDKITRYIADRAVAWAYTRGCHQYLMREDPEWWVEPIGLDHALAIAQGIERYTLCKLVCSQQQPARHRQAYLQPQGKAVYQATDPTLDWRGHLEIVRETLTWTAPHSDLAFLRHELGGRPNWSTHHQPWPHVNDADVRYNRPLLASFVPDANGIQMLTDAHLERAQDLSDWRIKSLAGGRHLVEATDLAPWYARPHPDPDVLAKARAEFGDMILTRELIQANSPW